MFHPATEKAVLLVALLAGGLPLATANAAEFFVATDGDDANPGTAAAPFATMERARDAVRSSLAAAESSTGVTVTLRGGTYRLAETLELTAADSGRKDAPVVYRSAPGEKAILSGGIPVATWTPTTDPAVLRRLDPSAHGKVLQADLRALGITDFGDYSEPSWASASGTRLELFVDGKPMTVARWPNDDWAVIEKIVGDPTDDVRGSPIWRSGAFHAPATASGRADRLERWAEEPTLKAHGYWYWDWADQRLEVASVDPATGIIALRNPEKHSYGYRAGQRCYLFDALCELDAPGEWHVDRKQGILYFYPPMDDLTQAKVEVSTLASPLVTLKDAAHIVLRNLTVEGGRMHGITVAGGEDIRIVGCELRTLGAWAVTIVGGKNHGVSGCDLHDLGAGGVSVTGGDLKTLTPAGHFVVNNHIHHFAHWERVYKPGVLIPAGVGIRVAHNLIHHAPHSAILFSGNDHLIEFNEIHSVCLETTDAGAIYSGRDWTWRGTIIRHNYIHHVFSMSGCSRMGVYLDDMFSSADVVGNVFHLVSRAVLIGGGRDNLVENNIFVDCNPSVHVDARALNWSAGHADGWLAEAKEKGTIKGVAFDQPPYRDRYPALAAILKGQPKAPEGNVIVRNVSWEGRFDGIIREARPYVTMKDNLVDVDPLFVDAAKGNFRLRPESPAWALGFKPIPFETIGLIDNDERASWPVVHQVAPNAVVVDVRHRRLPSPPPVFKVAPTSATVVIDGEITEAEWGGPAAAMVIEEEVTAGAKTAPASRAWIRHDGTGLLVAAEIPVKAGFTIRMGDRWGQDDAMEIALVNPAVGKDAPTLILRGYATGKFESSGESGAPGKAVTAAAVDVKYACRVVNPGLWTVEWRIPFASLGGVDLAPVGEVRMPFNLSVRKTGENLWQMWKGTGGRTWEVENAGIIEIGR
jgi:hypothetical protein